MTTTLPIMTDQEFLAVADPEQEEFNTTLLAMREEGRIQIFDDGIRGPLLVSTYLLN